MNPLIQFKKTPILRLLIALALVAAAAALTVVAALATQQSGVTLGAGTQKVPPTSSKPKEQAPPGIASRGPVFTFQTQTGALNEALKKIIELRLQPSETTDEESRIIAATAQAEAAVKREPAAAATIILENLRKLPSDDLTSHATLFSLLYLVAQEDLAIRYFQEVAMTGPPRIVDQPRKPERKNSQADRPVENRYEQEDPHVLVRYMAMSGLFTAARSGDPRAITAILATVKSPHREVKMTAVRYYYALSKSRLRAKVQMRESLAPQDQYLLNLY
jgi:hypothetical protein